MLKFFPKDAFCDAKYLQFLEDNPDCYVLNFGSLGYEPFIKIHRAGCSYINGERFSPHTGAGYTKVCADTRDELDRWREANGVSSASECQKCFK